MAQTNQNIIEFFNIAQSREFSRDFLFRVEDIQFQSGLRVGPQELIYARSAQLPARTITNVTVPYMGLPLNIPGIVQYGSSEGLGIEFYTDENSNLRKMFEDEGRRVFDEVTSIGEYGVPGAQSRMTLMQLNRRLEPVSKYVLIGCSIRNVGELSYTMAEGTGQPVFFNVTIAYHFFARETVDSGLGN